MPPNANPAVWILNRVIVRVYNQSRVEALYERRWNSVAGIIIIIIIIIRVVVMKQNCTEALNQHAQPMNKKAAISNFIHCHLLLLLFFDPGTQFPGYEKNYAMQYKKVQK